MAGKVTALAGNLKLRLPETEWQSSNKCKTKNMKPTHKVKVAVLTAGLVVALFGGCAMQESFLP
jgi:hypothetical protein